MKEKGLELISDRPCVGMSSVAQTLLSRVSTSLNPARYVTNVQWGFASTDWADTTRSLGPLCVETAELGTWGILDFFLQ